MPSTLEALKRKNEALKESRRASNAAAIAKKDKSQYTCDCGAIIKKYLRWQHEITNKHIKWLESQPEAAPAPAPAPEPAPEPAPVVKIKTNRKIKNVMVVPVEVPVVEAVPEPEPEPEPVVDHLKNAEDKVIEMALLTNSANNKLNRLYELVGDSKVVDNLNITQMISICSLVVRMKNDNN